MSFLEMLFKRMSITQIRMFSLLIKQLFCYNNLTMNSAAKIVLAELNVRDSRIKS